KGSRTKPGTCWQISTAGSPRASTRSICSRQKPCSKSFQHKAENPITSPIMQPACFVCVSQRHHRHPALPPEMVVGGVLRDAVEPSTRAARLVTVVPVLQYFHKRLVTQILRSRAIVD